MGDTITNGERHVLRVYVEPVELELDDDNALLISSLQSALPGASGLYYNNGCKASVTFDGKKLLPPTGGWIDRKYYATLGARPFDYPFGSYANASKQFERSVNAVQRLLGSGAVFEYAGVERVAPLKKKAPIPTTVPEKAENMKQLLSTVTAKSSSSPGTPPEQQKLTPIEQQFVDLARISTAKDSIIEQQRADNRTLQEQCDAKEKALKEALEELAKVEKRCAAQEEELAILRNLSKEQTYMCEKVNELTKQYVDAEQTISKQRNEIEELVKRIAQQEEERVESLTKIAHLQESLGTAGVSIEELEGRLESLKPLADRRLLTDAGQVLSYVEMSESLATLKARNEKLENDMNSMDERYQQLNQLYTEIVSENTTLAGRLKENEAKAADGDEIRLTAAAEAPEITQSTKSFDEIATLKNELALSENRVAELTRMVHTLTKDATMSESRADQAIQQRNEMKRSLELAETKIQETMTKERRKSEYLRHDLKDAQKRIAELTSLIADFSSDARNSRHDVADIL